MAVRLSALRAARRFTPHKHYFLASGIGLVRTDNHCINFTLFNTISYVTQCSLLVGHQQNPEDYTIILIFGSGSDAIYKIIFHSD
jgi:hypothetical protein